MSWNYRLVRRSHLPEFDESTIGVYEAYYDGDGNVTAITTEPINLLCNDEEGPEALKVTLEMISRAFGLPVLDYVDYECGS